jgi:hypothetical protein
MESSRHALVMSFHKSSSSMLGSSWNVIALLFLVIISLPLSGHEIPPKDDDPPVWRVNVRALSHNTRSFQGCLDCVQVCFLDESSLALTFQIADAVRLPMKNGSPNRSHGYRFQTTIFGVEDGHIRAIHDWESEFSKFRVIPTRDGKFILKTVDEIALYSASFDELHRRRLADANFPALDSAVAVSWDGRSLVIASKRGQEITLELIDSETFQLIASWKRTTRSQSSLWNVATANGAVALEEDNEIAIASAEQSWRTIYSNPKLDRDFGISLDFVNNDLLIADRGGHFFVLDLIGKQVFGDQFDARQQFLYIHTSRNGRTFAVQADKSILAVNPLAAIFDPILGSAPDKALVYDGRDGRPIYQRPIRGDRKHPIGSVAISPNAYYLAVLSQSTVNRSDGTVEVFLLPHSGGMD